GQLAPWVLPTSPSATTLLPAARLIVRVMPAWRTACHPNVRGLLALVDSVRWIRPTQSRDDEVDHLIQRGTGWIRQSIADGKSGPSLHRWTWQQRRRQECGHSLLKGPIQGCPRALLLTYCVQIAFSAVQLFVISDRMWRTTMFSVRNFISKMRLLLLFGCLIATGAANAENRIALVIGNAAYQAGALTTPANDAGLVAQTLEAAGFDVVGARDLDQDSLRRALRDFVDKAQASGPNTVAFIYLAGYGLQLEGENYFVPIDARIARDTGVSVEAVRISDYIRPLAGLQLKAGIVVLDAARPHPFAQQGPPLAGGLALIDAEPGMLVAFNATPGTVAPEGQGPYGAYAQALAEMMREGGLPLA